MADSATDNTVTPITACAGKTPTIDYRFQHVLGPLQDVLPGAHAWKTFKERCSGGSWTASPGAVTQLPPDVWAPHGGSQAEPRPPTEETHFLYSQPHSFHHSSKAVTTGEGWNIDQLVHQKLSPSPLHHHCRVSALDDNQHLIIVITKSDQMLVWT